MVKPFFLPTGTERINICCFKLTHFGVICYEPMGNNTVPLVKEFYVGDCNEWLPFFSFYSPTVNIHF